MRFLIALCSILMRDELMFNSTSLLSKYLNPPLIIKIPVRIKIIPIVFLKIPFGFAYRLSFWMASFPKNMTMKITSQNPKIYAKILSVPIRKFVGRIAEIMSA